MTDWQQLCTQLATALRSAGCRCQYQRDKRGVPIWAGIPLERVRLSTCSIHAALDRFDAAVSDEADEGVLILTNGVIA